MGLGVVILEERDDRDPVAEGLRDALRRVAAYATALAVSGEAYANGDASAQEEVESDIDVLRLELDRLQDQIDGNGPDESTR